MKTLLYLTAACCLVLAAARSKSRLSLGSPFLEPDELTTRTTKNIGRTTKPIPRITKAPGRESKKLKEYLFPKDCGTGTQERIFGGTEVALGQYPWLALLIYKNNSGSMAHFCGGSLVNQRYVLTAAHCTEILLGFKLKYVRLGEHDVSKPIDCNEDDHCLPPAIDVGIEDIEAHPNWTKGNHYADIALIRLDQNIEFREGIGPVCLPDPAFTPRMEEKQTLFVSGWGDTEHSISSLVKMVVGVPEVPASNCLSVYKTVPARQFKETKICAGGKKGKDSCAGDSGGPLMSIDVTYDGRSRAHIRGVVSQGFIKCGTKNAPAIYTRVSYYLDWIKNRIHL